MEKLSFLLDRNFEINLTQNQKELFRKFETLYLEWSRKINLSAIHDPIEIRIKHFYDSLSCFSILPVDTSFSLIDVGSGAGFPGIPLRIVNPSIQLTLVESVGKKADFCRAVNKELRLSSVEVMNTRAEVIGQNSKFREQFDWAIARAVAPLSTLAEYLIPLVKIGGSILAQKGGNIDKELLQADFAIGELGGNVKSVNRVELPDNMGMRSLLVITKVKPTPEKYPRRPGIPKKKPLA